MYLVAGFCRNFKRIGHRDSINVVWNCFECVLVVFFLKIPFYYCLMLCHFRDVLSFKLFVESIQLSPTESSDECQSNILKLGCRGLKSWLLRIAGVQKVTFGTLRVLHNSAFGDY